MAIIQQKRVPIVRKDAGFSYDPKSFSKHKVANFIEVDDPQEILDRIDPFILNERRFITFDTETHAYYGRSNQIPSQIIRRWVGSGKRAVPQDYPFSIQVCDGKHSYIIYDTKENNFKKFKQLAPLFEDASIDKIAHNWKFDAHMFANADMTIKGRVHDTVVLAKLIDENRKSFQLRDLVAGLPDSVLKFEQMVDGYKSLHKVVDYRDFPRELLTQYGGADVWNCYLSFIHDFEKLEEEDLQELYDKECELMVVLYAMERLGFTTDSDYEQPLKKELQQLVDDAEQAIYEEAGGFFNINSTKQLYEVLLKLGVDQGWIPLTEKGNPSLNKDVLAKLASKHNVNIVKNILEYRKNEKLLTTYAVGIYDQKGADSKVHCNINQTQATTGRMSITKPALQTLPKRDKSIRKAFVPDEDYALWFMDLDQIEYRLFAHYAQIPGLLASIERGNDIHATTASMIFHVDLDELTNNLHKYEELGFKHRQLVEQGADPADIQRLDDELIALHKYTEMRSRGKTINFALIYGVGISHLSELLNCSTTEATELKSIYFSQMPEARTFISTVYQVIKVRGYIRNFFGRRRRLDPDDCYKAPNALIQGCAADYIKWRLIDMYKYIMHNDLKAQIILIVHDEIVLMVPKDEEEHIPVFRWLLSDFKSFRCPITAGVEKGDPSWGQKITPPDPGFKEPKADDYLDYNIYNGEVFKIYKETANV